MLSPRCYLSLFNCEASQCAHATHRPPRSPGAVKVNLDSIWILLFCFSRELAFKLSWIYYMFHALAFYCQPYRCGQQMDNVFECGAVYSFLLVFADNSRQLPPLHPEQQLKLKQLTVMTLAEKAKVPCTNLDTSATRLARVTSEQKEMTFR